MVSRLLERARILGFSVETVEFVKHGHFVPVDQVRLDRAAEIKFSTIERFAWAVGCELIVKVA